jgi:hypothetical protein
MLCADNELGHSDMERSCSTGNVFIRSGEKSRQNVEWT